MYEIGIKEFYKNSNDKSPSPDGSGNPPDFFFGRLKQTAGIAFVEKAQAIRS